MRSGKNGCNFATANGKQPHGLRTASEERTLTTMPQDNRTDGDIVRAIQTETRRHGTYNAVSVNRKSNQATKSDPKSKTNKAEPAWAPHPSRKIGNYYILTAESLILAQDER